MVTLEFIRFCGGAFFGRTICGASEDGERGHGGQLMSIDFVGEEMCKTKGLRNAAVQFIASACRLLALAAYQWLGQDRRFRILTQCNSAWPRNKEGSHIGASRVADNEDNFALLPAFGSLQRRSNDTVNKVGRTG